MNYTLYDRYNIWKQNHIDVQQEQHNLCRAAPPRQTKNTEIASLKVKYSKESKLLSGVDAFFRNQPVAIRVLIGKDARVVQKSRTQLPSVKLMSNSAARVRSTAWTMEREIRVLEEFVWYREPFQKKVMQISSATLGDL